MVYENTRKKFSGFTKYNTVNLNDRVVGTKDGGNSNLPLQAIIDKFKEVHGGSFRVYEFESELIASDIQLDEYALVEENGFAFYKITNDAVAGNNLALDSGLTATYESNLEKSATSKDDLRTKLANGYCQPGNTVTLASTATPGINWDWTVRLWSTGDPVKTDNGGTIICVDGLGNPATDGQLYAERNFSGDVEAIWFVPEAEAAAIIDGTSTYDMSAEIRRAIDASAGSQGRKVSFPRGGAANCNSVVYIPITPFGTILEGNRFTLKGQGKGTNNIFETGRGSTSVGGSTNWNEPDETAIHTGTIIRNFNFQDCAVSMKLFNCLWTTKIEGNWANQNFDTMLHMKRCFYSTIVSNTALPRDPTRGDTEPAFWFEESNNAMHIMGNNASGVGGGGSLPKGIGWLFTGGVAGLLFANNGCEGSVTGLSITGEVKGASITGNYFELNTTSLNLGSAGKDIDVDSNFWYSNAGVAIDCAGGWARGKLGPGNSIDPATTVELNSSTNTMTIELPRLNVNLNNSYSSYSPVPPNFNVNPAAHVLRPYSAYDNAGGPGSQRALASQESTGNGITGMPYVGNIGPNSGDAPFCDVTIAVGSVTIDTNITYQANLPTQFTFIFVDGGGTQEIAGRIRHGNNVYRDDVLGFSVTAASAGGKLRVTTIGLSGTPTVTDARIWIG